VTDEYGDPEIDLEAAMADAVLRDLLGDVPVPDSADDPDRASLIEVVLATAWPDGTPPAVEELEHDPDFDAVMDIADVSEEADNFDAPDVSDGDDYDAPDGDDYDAPDGDDYDAPDDDADSWADDTGLDSPDGLDDQG
jgi:hypothetical protein